jgi:hypothetical protein
MWRHLPATYPAKAASATLQLFKQLTALLQTINCRKAWGKQPTGTEQGSLHCSVWNSHKCPANTATESEKYKASQGAFEGVFLPPILQKQHCPSALQTINCTLADYQLQKSIGQTTKRNRARLPSLFGMKFTQVPSRYRNWFAEQTTLPNNSVAFFLDNGTERWRKVVLDNLWRSHIDWHWLVSIWSVGSRWLLPILPFAIWQSIDIYKLNIHEEKWIWIIVYKLQIM